MPDEGRSRPELDSQCLALIVQHVADHDLRTLRYQQAGLRGTLAARPAAHKHYLDVEARHIRFPRLPTRKFGRSKSLVQHLLMLVTTGVGSIPTNRSSGDKRLQTAWTLR